MGGACSSEKEHEDYSVVDDDAGRLSDIGRAANDILQKKHGHYWHKLWNVTSGVIDTPVRQTPQIKYSWPTNQQPPDGHDNWFPENMGKIMSKTKYWCDVTSLGPPDGKFLEEFKKALAQICENAKAKDRKTDKPIIVRMMFGNIVGMPTNSQAVCGSLTEDLDEDANVQIWVGAWRRGVSWNHSKIIAVDGFYLHNGGHNLWDPHYLSYNPVHDLSMETYGKIAHDGHCYANEQWDFVKKEDSTFFGQLVSALPDSAPTVFQTRVSVCEWPEGVAEEYPPQYSKKEMSKLAPHPSPQGHIPMISMGRYGAMKFKARVSDEAIVAMFDAAQTIVHMALQDLGPITLPGLPGPIAVPGCCWPADYMSALGRAMWERDVDVEIALSNPSSTPAGLPLTQACYGNGWSCNDVASEIIKTIQEQYSDVTDETLRDVVRRNLRVTFIREMQGREWSKEEHATMGMHAKHFIIDDKAYYIGSQNLYIADLAEWGILIDDEKQTKKCMEEYWNPLWKASYTGEDYNEDEVMKGLGVDRAGGSTFGLSHKKRELIKAAEARHQKIDPNSIHHDQE